MAKQKQEYRQQILDTKSRDSSMFHKLLSKQKGRLVNCISELNVDDKHFSNLAAAQAYGHSDTEYMKLVQKDLSEIIELCKKSSDFNTQPTKSDLYEIIFM